MKVTKKVQAGALAACGAFRSAVENVRDNSNPYYPICPKCNTKVHYKDMTYDPESGESLYCWSCRPVALKQNTGRKSLKRKEMASKALKLRSKGLSIAKIAKRLGLAERTVRAYLET